MVDDDDGGDDDDDDGGGGCGGGGGGCLRTRSAVFPLGAYPLGAFVCPPASLESDGLPPQGVLSRPMPSATVAEKLFGVGPSRMRSRPKAVTAPSN